MSRTLYTKLPMMACEKSDMPDLSGLSEEEKQKVLSVLNRAKEFEAQEEKHLMMQPLEGILYKYTNVVKGWQYRYFKLEPVKGKLEYFEKEEHKNQRVPRATLPLAGAVVSPSDEDEQTFTINAANGEIYRLRALDAKERQHWVNRIRATAEHHTDTIAQNAPPLQPQRPLSVSQSSIPGSGSSKPESNTTAPRSQYKSTITPNNTSTPAASNDNFKSVKDMLSQAASQELELVTKIEDLPPSGSHINSLDKEMLLLKATSNATLVCLEQCLSILQQQQSLPRVHPAVTSATPSIEWLNEPVPTATQVPPAGIVVSPASPAESFTSAMSGPTVDKKEAAFDIREDEEVTDSEEYAEKDLGAVEDHKSVILHLLSQLKLGMDLTKVVLPTFILEKRSLLEMFADCMAHPDTFLAINQKVTSEDRMLAVLEWYLTSFHAGRRGAVAKKPYNPIIGEHFHCSWNVPDEEDKIRLLYCAEQVSHHPPVSAFYFQCPTQQMEMSGSIWTKSKFMGMSIGVVMVGKVILKLLEHNETYVFTLPSAYARSILTVPWMELGDRVTIQCNETGYSSKVVFETKPFYGGKLHKVVAEAKSPDDKVLCKVNGEWNDVLEFTYANGTSKKIDTKKLKVMRKRVKPLRAQKEFESRQLWRYVTESLKTGDLDAATEFKRQLEQRQRAEEQVRRNTQTSFPTKFFHLEGDTWVFNDCLKENEKGETQL